jgi:hypothetical protein
LLADADRAQLEKFFDDNRSRGKKRHFVGEEAESLGVFLGKIKARVISAALGIQTKVQARRKQNGRRGAHRALVPDEVAIGASVIMGVLMNIDDALIRRVKPGGALAARECQGRERALSKEPPSGKLK